MLCGYYAYACFFCHSTTGCADSAISGVKMLYHVAKNAISVSVCTMSSGGKMKQTDTRCRHLDILIIHV